MILYGAPLSPFVRKVLVFAAEKGLEMQLVPVGLGSRNPEFRAASPFGKMPALRDGDYTLPDSSAIVHYLDALHVTPQLIPADPKERGQAVWFDEFADTILFDGAGRRMFFNRVVSPRFLKRDGDLADATRAETEDLPPMLDWLEGAIPASGHLVGSGLSLADISVAATFVNLFHAGFVLVDARWPRLAGWVAAMHARPSFAARIEQERGILGA